MVVDPRQKAKLPPPEDPKVDNVQATRSYWRHQLRAAVDKAKTAILAGNDYNGDPGFSKSDDQGVAFVGVTQNIGAPNGKLLEATGAGGAGVTITINATNLGHAGRQIEIDAISIHCNNGANYAMTWYETDGTVKVYRNLGDSGSNANDNYKTPMFPMLYDTTGAPCASGFSPVQINADTWYVVVKAAVADTKEVDVNVKFRVVR